MNPRDVTLGAGSAPAQGVPFIRIPDHELLRQIGTGSYGEVWLGRSALRTYRAVKIVSRKRFTHERPFEREFSGIQKFEPISRSQEGLVHVLQVGRNNDAGYFYYVMELADDASGESGKVGKRVNERGSAEPNFSLTDSPTHSLTPDSYLPRTLAYDLRQRGRLPFDECLRIGLSLTAALAHLHKSGLVHRDIKPANIIFVNGATKLADIGLVAEVADAPSYVGTEGFIPPEGPGTMQADIYSLGKVLYEMTTGKDRHDYPELPTKLDETVNQAEFIELNEIILTACRADPRRRYASADQMRADLLLLQSGRSIKQVHKLERRLALATRIGIATAAAALLAVGGYIGSVKQIQRARRAERLAAANAATARSETAKSERVAQYLKDVLQDLGPSVAMVHDPAMVRGILDRASGRIDRDLANQPGTAIELRETLADIYRELGLYDKMAELARKNLELAWKTFGDDNRAVANALSQLGEAYFWRDKWDEAEAFHRMALRMRRKLLGNEHIDVARSLLLLGNALHSRTNTPAVEAVYREGLEICDRLPSSDEISLMKADFLQNLGVELRNGRLEEAEAASRQALEMKRKLDNQQVSGAKAIEVLAIVLRDAGKFGEADTVYHEALTAYTRLFGKDHHLVGRALSGLGETIGYEGGLLEAETMLREAVATYKRIGRNENFDLTYALGSLGEVLERQGKFAEAESAYWEVLEIRQRLSAKPRGYLLLHLAGVVRRQGRASEANALIPDAIAAFRNQSDLGEIEAQNSLAWLLSTHPSSQFRDGQSAMVYAGKAVTNTGRTNATYLSTLAAAYAEAHDFTRAVAVQKEAMALLVREEQRQDFASRLKLYEANIPYREPE